MNWIQRCYLSHTPWAITIIIIIIIIITITIIWQNSEVSNKWIKRRLTMWGYLVAIKEGTLFSDCPLYIRGSSVLPQLPTIALFVSLLCLFVRYAYLTVKTCSCSFSYVLECCKTCIIIWWSSAIAVGCGGVPRGGGVQTPPPPKFRSFAKAEPNSQFRGIYVHP
jgi:hypothetical protein